MDFNDMDIYDAFLEHHGILGMKWGIRRYQPYSTRGRSSGKRGREIGEAAKSGRRRKRREAHRAAKAAKRAEEQKLDKKKAKKQAQRERKEYERKKQEAIKSGSAKAVSPYIRNLSDKELEQAIKRIDNTRKLQDLSAKEMSAGEIRLNKTMNRIGRYTDYVNTGMKAYNTAATIHNFMYPDQQWRKFDTGGNKNKDKDKNKK